MKKCSCRRKISYLLVTLAVFALASLIVMYLLNTIIGATTMGMFASLSYWKAAGILLLCRILFGRWKIRKCMQSMCGCGCCKDDESCGCDDKKDEATTCTMEK